MQCHCTEQFQSSSLAVPCRHCLLLPPDSPLVSHVPWGHTFACAPKLDCMCPLRDTGSHCQVILSSTGGLDTGRQKKKKKCTNQLKMNPPTSRRLQFFASVLRKQKSFLQLCWKKSILLLVFFLPFSFLFNQDSSVKRCQTQSLELQLTRAANSQPSIGVPNPDPPSMLRGQPGSDIQALGFTCSKAFLGPVLVTNQSVFQAPKLPPAKDLLCVQAEHQELPLGCWLHCVERLSTDIHWMEFLTPRFFFPAIQHQGSIALLLLLLCTEPCQNLITQRFLPHFCSDIGHLWFPTLNGCWLSKFLCVPDVLPGTRSLVASPHAVATCFYQCLEETVQLLKMTPAHLLLWFQGHQFCTLREF